MAHNVYEADRIYEQYVSREGLYGKAFFGHAASPAEQRRLNNLWRKARKEAQRNRRND